MSKRLEISYPNRGLQDAARMYARKNLRNMGDGMEFMINIREFAKSPSRTTAMKTFNGDKQLVDIIFNDPSGGGDVERAGPRWKKFWAAVRECWDEFWDGASETCC